jgi:hypothetical protein
VSDIPTYRIRDWNKHFEKAQTRACKAMTWISLPTKYDGTGYRKLIADNPLNYLAWVLLVGVASKCEPRGTLTDSDGNALTVEDMAFKTGVQEKIFEASFKALCKVGWLEALYSNCNGTATSLQHADSTLIDNCSAVATTRQTDRQDKTLQDKTEQDKQTAGESEFERFYELYPNKKAPGAAERAFVNIDGRICQLKPHSLKAHKIQEEI